MNPLPGKCPVCDNTLTVTRLQCGQCGTGIDGAFGLGRLQALTAEQVQFVETFIKCRGKIKDVEGELGVSYPTVVARLNEVVRAMGYDVDDSDMSEVDQFEFYQAQVLNPRAGSPHPAAPAAPATPAAPFAPTTPFTPMAPTAPTAPPAPRLRTPAPSAPRLNPEQRQQILDDLAAGKISAAEAMKKLHG